MTGKFYAAAAAAALAWLAPAAPATAADFVMKFGTATINETQHQFIKFYKEELEKASGGRIEVQVYPASQLGPIPREIEGVQLGNIQGFIGPVDFFVGVDPRFGVFSAPMLFKDDANAEATINDPAVRKAMFDLAAPKRMVGIATLSIGAADYGAKKPLMTLADFSGKKLRINGTELERQKMAKLGATGVGMPLSEVMPALDQGTIDGTISGISVFVSLKMNDLIKVITVTNDTSSDRHRRGVEAVARYAAAGPAKDRHGCRRDHAEEGAGLGDRFHQTIGEELDQRRRRRAHAFRGRSRQDEDTAGSGCRRRHQGSAGGA